MVNKLQIPIIIQSFVVVKKKIKIVSDREYDKNYEEDNKETSSFQSKIRMTVLVFGSQLRGNGGDS